MTKIINVFIFYYIFILTDACEQPSRFPTMFSIEAQTLSSFPVGTQITYQCRTGYYTQSGNNKATCVIFDGSESWDGPTLKCSPRTCSSPERVENGRIIGSLYTFAQNITYECDPGYKKLDSPRLHKFCLASGKWGGGIFKCNPVECPEPVKPENGNAQYSEYTYGKQVQFSCNKPLVLKGSEYRTCRADKTWSGEQPTCEQVQCPNPARIEGGKVFVQGNGVGDITTFLCDDSPVEVVSMCQAEGTWFPAPPICTETKATTVRPPTQSSTGPTTQHPNTKPTSSDMCGPPPKVENAYHDHSKAKEFSPNAIVMYECNKGCKMEAANEQDQQAVCTKINMKMTWTQPKLKCNDCQLVFIIVGAVVGGLILGIIVVVIICCIKKRRNNSALVFQSTGKKQQEDVLHKEESLNLNERI